jgi:hypothetical protein
MGSTVNPPLNQTWLEKVEQLVHFSLRPLPRRFGDGRYNSDVFPEPTRTGILKDLESQVPRIPADINLIIEIIETLYRGGLQNDAQYTVTPLPPSSALAGCAQLMFYFGRRGLMCVVDGKDYRVCCVVTFDVQDAGQAL